MTKETTCIEGKDEVYFKDSCGNIANIYDSSKINDKGYWNKVIGNACSHRFACIVYSFYCLDWLSVHRIFNHNLDLPVYENARTWSA